MAINTKGKTTHKYELLGQTPIQRPKVAGVQLKASGKKPFLGK